MIEDEKHGLDCGCWLCDGREPDNSSIEYNLRLRWGSCAYCGQALGPHESTVHTACSGAFYEYITA